MTINNLIPLNDLLSYAKSQILKLESGEEFMVKELFRGYEWKRIKIGNRTKLGSLFLVYAQGEGSSIIEILGKTPQNQQIYRKR